MKTIERLFLSTTPDTRRRTVLLRRRLADADSAAAFRCLSRLRPPQGLDVSSAAAGRRLSIAGSHPVVVLDRPPGNRGRSQIRIRSGVLRCNFGLFWDQLAQGAITDVAGKKFHYFEHVSFSMPKRPKNRFDLSADKGALIATGGSGKDHLHSEIDGMVSISTLKRPKRPSCTTADHTPTVSVATPTTTHANMATTGTLTIDGVPHKVTGTSWFDRQYGDLIEAITQGWQVVRHRTRRQHPDHALRPARQGRQG